MKIHFKTIGTTFTIILIMVLSVYIVKQYNIRAATRNWHEMVNNGSVESPEYLIKAISYYEQEFFTFRFRKNVGSKIHKQHEEILEELNKKCSAACKYYEAKGDSLKTIDKYAALQAYGIARRLANPPFMIGGSYYIDQKIESLKTGIPTKQE